MTLRELAQAIEKLHLEALFGGEGNGVETEGMNCFAEQELLSAFAHLRLAEAAAMRASYHQNN